MPNFETKWSQADTKMRFLRNGGRCGDRIPICLRLWVHGSTTDIQPQDTRPQITRASYIPKNVKQTASSGAKRNRDNLFSCYPVIHAVILLTCYFWSVLPEAPGGTGKRSKREHPGVLADCPFSTIAPVWNSPRAQALSKYAKNMPNGVFNTHWYCAQTALLYS